MSKLPHFIHNTNIGQNFLRDHSVIDFIIERAALTEKDQVLEIGPGEGILTEALLSSECSSVCTLELDTRLKHVIEMLGIQNKKLTPLWGDAVQFDYENSLPWYPNKIIANLPYHITTPLLWVFLEKLVKHKLEYLLLMVQLESAQRITAPERNRERSPLGIMVDAMGTSKILRKVPPSAFRPQPKVNSCIIEIKLDKNLELPSNKSWRALLSRSFAQRRKTIVNNWIAGYEDLTKETAQNILEKHNLRTTTRAEELTLDNWLELLKEPAFLINE